MFNCKVEKSGDRLRLVVNGSLTIENAASLKKVLIKSMKKAEHVDLHIDNVPELDLSCLQLLCSAHKTYRDSNKYFTLSSGSAEAFSETVKAAGLLRHMGCESECEKSCLWSNCS